MKCMNCGAEIEEGVLYCSNCGTEVQIVPDYNPLDEVLAAQVRGAINEGGSFTLPVDNRKIRNTAQKIQRKSQEEVIRDNERRKRQAEKRRQLKKRKKKIMLFSIVGVLLLIGIIGFVIFQNSYTGQVKKGYKALNTGEYEKAIVSFEKAISKQKEKPAAYTGLSKVYVEQQELEKAETMFLDTIEDYPNEGIYQATIDFYIDTEQLTKIPVLLNACENETILSALKDYQSEVPEFSLEEGTYDDVQEVTLTTDGKAIYYTIDGSEPTVSSTKYKEPIQLSEGTTKVRAIAINKKDIPSLVAMHEYEIELPIEDAPAVTPSTGQYEQNMQITIQVPTGYDAYYTLDGTTPTTSSKKYTGPIDMPEGDTLFSAILVNAKGKMSDVTKRNYNLYLE